MTNNSDNVSSQTSGPLPVSREQVVKYLQQRFNETDVDDRIQDQGEDTFYWDIIPHPRSDNSQNEIEGGFAPLIGSGPEVILKETGEVCFIHFSMFKLFSAKTLEEFNEIRFPDGNVKVYKTIFDDLKA